MKKLVALLLVLVMVVGMFAACDTNKPVETKPGETQPNKPAETKPAETEKAFSHPVTTDPITITILTARHDSATLNASDTWFMKWLPKSGSTTPTATTSRWTCSTPWSLISRSL